jgi:hypothetical protein
MHGGVEPLKLLFYKVDLKEFQSSVPEIKIIFSESLGITLLNHYRKTEQRTKTDKDWSSKVLALNITRKIFIWDVLFLLDLQVFATSKWFCIWNCRLNYSIANISIQSRPFVDYTRVLETRQN